MRKPTNWMLIGAMGMVSGCQFYGPIASSETTHEQAMLYEKNAATDPEAAFRLSLWHAVSRQDEVAALPWEKMAADNGHSVAAFNYSFHMERAGRYTDAVRYASLAAGSGNAEAVGRLAGLLERGRNGEVDHVAIRRLHIRAGKMGQGVSADRAVEMMTSGEGGPVDIEGAVGVLEAYLRNGDGMSTSFRQEIQRRILDMRGKLESVVAK